MICSKCKQEDREDLGLPAIIFMAMQVNYVCEECTKESDEDVQQSEDS